MGMGFLVFESSQFETQLWIFNPILVEERRVEGSFFQFVSFFFVKYEI